MTEARSDLKNTRMWSGARRVFHNALERLPDELAIRILYFRSFGRLPNIVNPSTFNEKVQHRKLYERNPLMSTLTDKIEVKKYVEGKLGRDWIIPTLYCGVRLPPVGERNWEVPYIIKPSHRSAATYVVRDLKSVDWHLVDTLCSEWTSSLHAQHAREWAYSRLKPRILVEPFLGAEAAPPDYRFFVFNSRVHYIQVDVGRFVDHTRAFFDRDWRRQPFMKGEFPPHPVELRPPATLNKMIEAAELLGRDWSFVRVDLYEIVGIPKFGELTFYPSSGMLPFRPAKWDRILGDLWPICD